jgi:hypothetical protein
VESGSHHSLLRQRGLYASLYEEQFEGGGSRRTVPTATSWPMGPSGNEKRSPLSLSHIPFGR